MVRLKIDPEFRDKIPPLTDAEFEQLRENILSDGEVYEPIVTWNDTIVDGHNRWRIICENWDLLENKFRTKQKEFADKYEAVDWMCKKQLGRRNLSDEQRTVLIGKMYSARKQSVGGQIPGSAQNEHPIRTADLIANELGIGKETVKRAEQFANGIDALREVSEEAADKVMRGGSGVKKETVRDIPKMDHEEVESLANDIISGDIKKKTTSGLTSTGWTKKDRSSREETNAIVADMYDPSTVPEYTVDDLVAEIQVNAEMFVSTLRGILKDRSNVLNESSRPAVADAITTHIINEFKKVRDLVHEVSEGA